jgi:hypothetical protein
MTQENACVGVIVLLLIALIAYFVVRRRSRGGRRGQHFLSGGQVVYDEVAPAPPSARKAAAGLYATLDQVSGLGGRYVALADALAAAGAKPQVPASETAPASPATWMLGARQGVASLTRSLRGAGATLRAAPPTWAGYWAVYRGLALSDAALLCAAKTYEAAGHQIHQQLEAVDLGAPAPNGSGVSSPLIQGALSDGSPYLLPESDSGLAEAGALLIALGAQLRVVVRAIHQLGVTLDLE